MTENVWFSSKISFAASLFVHPTTSESSELKEICVVLKLS